MIDCPKIGIVFRKNMPQFLEDSGPERSLEGFDWLPEDELLRSSPNGSRDFLAVFFPVDNETPEVRRRLSALFPDAEMVGYREAPSASAGSMERDDDGRLTIRVPVPFSHLRFLLETLSADRTSQRELVRARQRADEVRDLFDAFIETIESSPDLADERRGVRILIDKLLDRVRAQECILYRGDSGDSLQRVFSTGNLNTIDLFEQQANRSIVENVLGRGEPYIDNHCDVEVQAPFGEESVFIRSMLCYPLRYRGETVGIIELLNRDGGAFTGEDRSVVETMLAPLSVAIRTASRFESLERLIVTDDLTRLHNYRYLKKYLEDDVKRCLRYKKKVSLLFIDVDGFKKVNDTFGHLVGSQSLAEIGQVLKRIVRDTDVVGRYGGDEFVVILPETPLNGAMVAAERIRKKVEECEFVAHNVNVRLTVSVGVANCPKHTMTAEGLIKKADAAMYRAKELSKNSIKVAV